jgi:hypothetical protein
VDLFTFMSASESNKNCSSRGPGLGTEIGHKEKDIGKAKEKERREKKIQWFTNLHATIRLLAFTDLNPKGHLRDDFFFLTIEGFRGSRNFLTANPILRRVHP